MNAALIKTARVNDTIYSLDTRGRIWASWGRYRPSMVKHGVDAAFFENYVAKMRLDAKQKSQLGRREVSTHRTSMWGAVQNETRYGEGVYSVSTAGHGGFILSDDRNTKIDATWRAHNGQYEEDCCWAIVAFTFPELFTNLEIEYAYRTLMNDYPDQFQALSGIVLAEVDSNTLQQRAAALRNKGKWIVISALNDNGMVRCIATINGDRSSKNQRVYLVPKDEYAMPVGGFVIDEARHALAA